AVNVQVLEIGRVCYEFACWCLVVFAMILIASSLLHLYLVLVRGRVLLETSVVAKLLLTVSSTAVVLTAISLVGSAITTHGLLAWAEAEILVLLNVRFLWEMLRFLWRVGNQGRNKNMTEKG